MIACNSWHLLQEKRCKIKFRHRYCCVSVIMRPSGYFVSPHVTHGAIWVWDPWIREWLGKKQHSPKQQAETRDYKKNTGKRTCQYGQPVWVWNVFPN